MEETNFQYIWTQWIVPLVQDLYSQLDDEFRKYCNVQIRDLDKVCLGAEKYYQKKREEVKKHFMVSIVKEIQQIHIEWIFTKLER